MFTVHHLHMVGKFLFQKLHFNMHPVDRFRCEADPCFNLLDADLAEALMQKKNKRLVEVISKMAHLKALTKRKAPAEMGADAQDGDYEDGGLLVMPALVNDVVLFSQFSFIDGSCTCTAHSTSGGGKGGRGGGSKGGGGRRGGGGGGDDEANDENYDGELLRGSDGLRVAGAIGGDAEEEAGLFGEEIGCASMRLLHTSAHSQAKFFFPPPDIYVISYSLPIRFDQRWRIWFL
jgi:hypothetical protein